METLLESKTEIIACDMHPKYNTTMIAMEMAKERNLPLIQVQHHYAHIVSCMAENDYTEPVIGVSFDGTGYGLDGTIWGGEFLLSTCEDFKRIGSIRPFLQIGGDASAKEGWRIAVSMLNSIYKEQAEEIVEKLGLCDKQNYSVQKMMAKNKINSVMSTSAGRLFDAVSAILGIRRSSSFEGEASMTLEFEAESYTPKERILPVIDLCEEEGRFILPTEEIVKKMVEGKLLGENTKKLAYDFHELLANLIVQGCKKAREETNLRVVALSGGVFQNQLLLQLCDEKLTESGFTVLKHSLLPPNDGGIALGQAVVAMTKLMK
jgi:hydrogenase maturation protein HypF